MSEKTHETARTRLALGAQFIQAARHGLMIMAGPHTDIKVLFANSGVEAITGYPAPEIEGRSPRFLVARDENPAELEALCSAIAEGRSASVLIRASRKGGETFWASIDVDPVRDGGTITHYIATIQDVSERAVAQARLAQLSQFESIGRLTGAIAHDFNNILASVRSFAGLLADASAAASAEHEYATRIVSACHRAADMVRQLLAFLRAQDAPRERIHICDTVNEVAVLLRVRLEGTTRLSTHDLSARATVLANASQLTQVLLNVAINACDAMVGRGGTLSISTRDVAVGETPPFEKGLRDAEDGFQFATDRLKPQKSYVRIAVADTGTGIPREVIGSIFEPFFTTKDKRRGSGLGLAIVQSIVTTYGGVIVVGSRPGQGTAFDIYLPAEAPLRAVGSRSAPESDCKDHLRGRERLLVVDDEVDVADAFSISLTSLGYAVTRAYGSASALAILASSPGAFDLLVTDQNMPGMKGIALIGKARAFNPSLKAVLCSGSGSVDDDRVTAGAAEGFFGKPGSPMALAHVVRAVLDGQSTA